MTRTSSIVTIAIAIGLASCKPAGDTDEAGALKTKEITQQAYIYALPMVAGYKAIYGVAVDTAGTGYRGPWNQIHSDPGCSRRPTRSSSRRTATRPTPCCLDLRAEPIVICVPAVEKTRYYSVQIIDRNTFNYGYIGSRATGNEAGRLSRRRARMEGRDAGRHQQVFHSRRNSLWRIFRTQLFGPADMPNVVKVQAGYQVRPLSTYLKQPAPPAAPAIDFPGVRQRSMVKTEFFQYRDFVLQFIPAGAGREGNARSARPDRHGAGQAIRVFEGYRLEHKAEVGLGMKDGDSKVEDKVEEGRQDDQWLERRLSVRRPVFLQRRLAAAGCRRQGGHLRQQCRRGDVPWRRGRIGGEDARWQQAQLHADLRGRAVAAGERLLVGDDV